MITRSMRRRIVAAMTITAAAALAAQAPPRSQFTRGTITTQAGEVVKVETATLEVPENRSRRDGPSIQLAIVRFRSNSPTPDPPVVYLSGGPGTPGISNTRTIYPVIAALRARHDVITFDQRGTGRSQPSLTVRDRLQMPLNQSLTSEASRAALTAAARAVVGAMRDRAIDFSAYNTEENADDLDDIRSALGIDKWIVWGHSYGSHLAFAYLRRHERAVERLVVSGVNGLDQRRRLPLDGDAFLEQIDRMVTATPSLARVMPDFLGTTRRVLDRLAKQPVTVEVDGERVFIGKGELQTLIAWESGDRDFVAALPMLIGMMDAGEYDEAARQIRDTIKRRGLGTAMTYAMDIASGVSPDRAAEIQRQASRALLGNAVNWPLGDPDFVAPLGIRILPDAFRAPLNSRVPSLFVSGTLDGRTSLRDAEAVRAGFPNSGHIIIDGASHTPYGISAALRDRILAFASGARPSDERLTVDIEWRGPDEPAMVAELTAIGAASAGGEAVARRIRQLATDRTRHFTSYVVSAIVSELAAAKRHDDARVVLAAAVEIFPRDSALLTRLGEAELARGNTEAAVELFKRAWAAGPLNDTARLHLEKFRSQ